MRYRIDTERVDLFDVNIVITMKVSFDKDIPFEDAQKAFYKACSFMRCLIRRWSLKIPETLFMSAAMSLITA